MDFSKMKSMFNNMKGAAAMAARAKQLAERMEATVVTGRSGADMALVKMSAARKVLDVKLDPKLVDGSQKVVVVEDLVKAAMNDALKRAMEAEVSLQREAMEELIKGMAGDAAAGAPADAAGQLR